MTDRVKGLVVTLNEDYRTDDVEVIINAIRRIGQSQAPITEAALLSTVLLKIVLNMKCPRCRLPAGNHTGAKESALNLFQKFTTRSSVDPTQHL